MDLTPELKALKDMAVQPQELSELFAMVEGMPEVWAKRFRECRTYSQIWEIYNLFTYETKE